MAEILRIFKIQHHIRIPHPWISLGANFQVHSSILYFGNVTLLIYKSLYGKNCKRPTLGSRDQEPDFFGFFFLQHVRGPLVLSFYAKKSTHQWLRVLSKLKKPDFDQFSDILAIFRGPRTTNQIFQDFFFFCTMSKDH